MKSINLKMFHNKKNAMKLNLFFLIIILLFSNLISAGLDSAGVYKIDEEFNFTQPCADASYITLSVIKTPTSTLVVNDNMSLIAQGVYYYNYTPTELGKHYFEGVSDGCEKSFATYIDVSSSGRVVSDSKIFANIILFVFFIIIILLFFYTTKHIDYERWHNSIISKYENRNYIKVLISSIGYNVMKNKFIWYYLFGLPLILLITDIAYTFGVDSMINLLQIFLTIYYFGFIIVGVFFFGYIQEWTMQIIDQIKSMDFGVE